MPDPTDEELGIPEGLDPNIRAELRRSRELARENESLKATSAAAERDAAFARAGIPDTPLGQMFGKAYDGPTDDPEAIKASFQALGGASAPVEQTSDAELAAQRQLAQVGSQGDPGGDIRFEDAINSTKSVDEVMALIASAPEGATTYIEGRQRRVGVPVIE
jgi:hypothetical protein